MRGSRVVLAGLVGALLAVAGCGDDPAGGGTASQDQTCAAAEQAMTDLGADLQTALLDWDGTPENSGDITATAERWGQELRDLAAEAADGELRSLLEDLAAQIEDFGASWADGDAEPNLDPVESALRPLEDRCGFGGGGGGPAGG
jgi:hypothetical protein